MRIDVSLANGDRLRVKRVSNGHEVVLQDKAGKVTLLLTSQVLSEISSALQEYISFNGLEEPRLERMADVEGL